MFAFRLANVLEEIAHSELIAEKLRQRLFHSIDFENRALFKSLQISQKDCLTSEDISQYLIQQGHKVDQHEAHSFIELYDADIDGRLSFHEFSNFLTPLSRYIAPSLFYTPDELKKELAGFIEFEIHNYKKMKRSIEKLTHQEDWITASNFALIDKEGRGCLDLTNLGRFFEITHKNVDYDEIFALCRRLNRGTTGKVPYSNFMSWFNELLGKSNNRHHACQDTRREMSKLVCSNLRKEELSFSEKSFKYGLNKYKETLEGHQMHKSLTKMPEISKNDDRLKTSFCYLDSDLKGDSLIINKRTPSLYDSQKFGNIESSVYIGKLSNRDLMEFADRELALSVAKSHEKHAIGSKSSYSSSYSSKLVDQALRKSYDNLAKLRSLGYTFSSFGTSLVQKFQGYIKPQSQKFSSDLSSPRT